MCPSPSSSQVVVVGAGISGLACAYRLKQLGADVLLLEAEDSVGGLIATTKQNGFLFESAPQSFQGTSPLLETIRQLGIEDQLQAADPRAPRYILCRGRLQKIPMSPQGLLTSSFLSLGSRWKVASEPFRRTTPPSHDESVADFVRRKFGHEILEYLVSPFVSGVYAGDPERLSLRAAFPSLDEWERQFGSVLRGAMKSRPSNDKRTGPPPLCSFRGGLATLMNAFAESLGASVRLNSRVEEVRAASSGSNSYEIRVNRNGANETVSGRAVIISIPAYTVAQILQPTSPAIAHSLSGIAYAPVAVVAAVYYAKQLAQPLNGFGFLVPRSEKMRTLGTVWNSSLFPGRAPEGSVVMTSFLGGATDAEILAKSESEISDGAHTDNAAILGISGPPQTAISWKHPKALPQYNQGHGHIVESLRDNLRRTPGLFLAGNYLEGPSIGKCLEQAFATAASAHSYLQQRP